jgi:hypothetical protein
MGNLFMFLATKLRLKPTSKTSWDGAASLHDYCLIITT